MEQTNDRLAITAGLLTLPNAQGTQAWFNIFVSESSLHFEIQEGATYTYSAPKFLLDDVRTQGYGLPAVSVEAMERFTRSGGRVIEAMVVSVKSKMPEMARHEDTACEWLTKPEALIWRLVKAHVPADIQLAVFALLKAYRPDFKEDGAVVVKRREDTS